MDKWFVSCIIPGDRQVGVVQLEAEAGDVKDIVERMAPCRCEFQAWCIEKFDDEIPVGEFVDADRLKTLGY